MVTIIENSNEIHVKIAHGRLKNSNTNKVRSVYGAKFLYSKKVWQVPLSQKEKIQGLFKSTEYNKVEWIVNNFNQPEAVFEVQPMPDLDFDLKLETGKLFPYQTQGVAAGLKFKQFINGDEQGLGKTLQSIATIYAAHQKGENVFPCLIVCPSSLKINWEREWKQWTGLEAMILDDKSKETWHRFYELDYNRIFIVNYESLKKFFVKKMPPKGGLSKDIELDERVGLFKSVIFDEIHRCKDPSTQQTKISLRVAQGKQWVLGLTGTPVVNKPIDIYSQLCIIGKINQMGGPKFFKLRYCEGGHGSSNLLELRTRLLNTCFFRREKKDVAKDLPDKIRQTILCDITNRRDYEKAKNEFVRFLEEKGCSDAEIAKKLKGEIMVKMGELKRIAALGKLNEVKDFVTEVLEGGNKLVLFCSLTSIVDSICKMFPGAVTITGKDDMDSKQRSIDAFQNDPKCKLIVCNIKAAGVGITLTASSRVAFVEYPWTYADCVQCEDRCHRIGQKDTVTCTYFLGANTIDEKLYQMIQEKRHVGNTITGATDTMEMSFVDNLMTIFK